MQNIIFNVIQDMSQFLSVSQLQELQKSLIKIAVDFITGLCLLRNNLWYLTLSTIYYI